MREEMVRAAAGWLAEALETGNPLAPLPEGAVPRSREEGEAVAEALLDLTGLAPCGLRLAPGPEGGPVAGPVLEARLLGDGARLPLAALRHARASAAIVGVLGEPLEEGREAPPILAALHPALDITCWRFRDPPETAALAAADLAGLGHLVLGRRRTPPEAPVPVALAPAGRRPRGEPRDLRAAFAAAAAEARRLGGLPAGALLVVAGLSPALAPEAETPLAASFGPLGRVRVDFV
ncbi:hypothetical protein [Crenalkalicoccus roseus]|uniref:hypothetical protein n=1 Tax=Crenalkalicoccus roseus TaxID=1485588 RepID=UPI0010805A4C|nr:hypothetical protein [Crenalkalicoccus roseus]